MDGPSHKAKIDVENRDGETVISGLGGEDNKVVLQPGQSACLTVCNEVEIEVSGDPDPPAAEADEDEGGSLAAGAAPDPA
jgi:hypothetical protein